MGEVLTLQVIRGGSGRKEELIVKDGMSLYREDWEALEGMNLGRR